MWSNRNSHAYLVGMRNSTATAEGNLAVSYETKRTFTIQSSNRTPWYLSNWAENVCPRKTLRTGVYGSSIHNCQNLKHPKCPSVGNWINKLQCTQIMEYYSAIKKQATKAGRSMKER